jgi:hypothetical protein
VILDDFVMLGTTVPEPNSDGRVFVCSAGYSAEMRGLIRIYPLARRNIPRRWQVYRVPVELNPRDSRPESYRVAGDRTPDGHERINQQFTEVGGTSRALRSALLRKTFIGSIKEANERRLSLALIAPSQMRLHFDLNPTSPDSPQLALFDGPEAPSAGAARFPYIPRIEFRDDLGWHNLMLRDWGCYELMRKHPERREDMAAFLHLTPSSCLLVGNLNQHRTSWLVISVLNGLREAEGLFDLEQS